MNSIPIGDRGFLIYKYVFDFLGVPFTWEYVNIAVVINIIAIVILLFLAYRFRLGPWKYWDQIK